MLHAGGRTPLWFDIRDRFWVPRPDFESGHALPSPTTPHPALSGWEYVDLLMLVALLGIATWLVLRRRRRMATNLLRSSCDASSGG